ncbi:hypothetical protein OF83DRAFT_1179758 [Amylostereum chailletii]|nr:hypothetical protein OF83DRAFT_1179758 [Amylostereum chailletii]
MSSFVSFLFLNVLPSALPSGPSTSDSDGSFPPAEAVKPPQRLHACHRPGNRHRKRRPCPLSLEILEKIFEHVDLVDL